MYGNQEHTLWVEKFRPSTLDGYVGNELVISKVKIYLQNGDVPHLLFYGQAGTGKTTLAKIIANNVDADVFSYRDEPLTNMQEYCYALGSNYDEGTSELSDSVCETPYSGPPASDLIATDLSGTIGLNCANNMKVKPKVGDFYMFPSWLDHQVYPFRSKYKKPDIKGERRSFSMNIVYQNVKEDRNKNKSES